MHCSTSAHPSQPRDAASCSARDILVNKHVLPLPGGDLQATQNEIGVEALVRRAIKYGYCAHSAPTVASLCDQGDQ